MATPAIEKPRPKERHKIRITVGPTGNFTYAPSHLRAKRGDILIFSSDGNKPFEVMFKSHSPGDKLYLSNDCPEMPVRDDIPYGIYRYAAAVWDEARKRVFLDSGCGEVGVEK